VHLSSDSLVVVDSTHHFVAGVIAAQSDHSGPVLFAVKSTPGCAPQASLLPLFLSLEVCSLTGVQLIGQVYSLNEGISIVEEVHICILRLLHSEFVLLTQRLLLVFLSSCSLRFSSSHREIEFRAGLVAQHGLAFSCVELLGLDS
jgi:hypothetical protein